MRKWFCKTWKCIKRSEVLFILMNIVAVLGSCFFSKGDTFGYNLWACLLTLFLGNIGIVLTSKYGYIFNSQKFVDLIITFNRNMRGLTNNDGRFVFRRTCIYYPTLQCEKFIGVCLNNVFAEKYGGIKQPYYDMDSEFVNELYRMGPLKRLIFLWNGIDESTILLCQKIILNYADFGSGKEKDFDIVMEKANRILKSKECSEPKHIHKWISLKDVVGM